MSKKSNQQKLIRKVVKNVAYKSHPENVNTHSILQLQNDSLVVTVPFRHQSRRIEVFEIRNVLLPIGSGRCKLLHSLGNV